MNSRVTLQGLVCGDPRDEGANLSGDAGPDRRRVGRSASPSTRESGAAASGERYRG